MTHIVKTKDGIEIDLAEVQRLWDNPLMSATQIGAVFGVSKGVILGHTNRRPDMFPARKTGQKPKYKIPSVAKPKAATKVSTDAKPRNRRVNIQNIHKARQEACEREVEAFKDGTSKWLQIPLSDEERLNTGKTLLERGHDECCWPLNSGGPFIFCAAPTGGSTYCSHHAHRLYRPLEKR